MSLRSPTENEIALTLALSPFDKAQGRRWNGRGNFSIQRALDAVRRVSFYPRPFIGRGKGEGAPSLEFLKETRRTRSKEFLIEKFSDLYELGASVVNGF